MPLKRPKWEEIDPHERGWSMDTKEAYERSNAEHDKMLAEMRASMSKEAFEEFCRDCGYEWIDD